MTLGKLIFFEAAALRVWSIVHCATAELIFVQKKIEHALSVVAANQWDPAIKKRGSLLACSITKTLVFKNTILSLLCWP